MMRSGMVLLLLELGILLILSLKGHCLKISRSTNKSGGDFDFQIHPQKEFELTHLLTNGRQYSQYLLKNNIFRYFFILRREHVPLSLEVTPCVSRLDWNVTLIRRLPEETPLVTDYDELNDQFRSSSQALGMRLDRYTGDERYTYSSKSAESGIYKIEVKPLDSDTYIKLFASVSYHLSSERKNKPPELGSVSVRQRGKRRLKISWPSYSVHAHPVLYCVALNKQKNFKTQCGFRSYAFGDKPKLKPETFYYRRKFRKVMQNMSPVRAALPKDFGYKCMSNKTSYSYKGLRAGQVYYIDVFVLEKTSRRMITHSGTSIRAKDSQKQGQKKTTLQLSDGKAKSITLKRTLKSQNFVYDLKSPKEQLMFSISPCGGSIRVKLYSGKSLIQKAKVKSLEYFTVDHAQPNKYYVTVSVKGRKARQFTILATTTPSKFSYPKLPDNTQINVYQSLIGCNSVTIGWMVTDKRQMYCIYKRELNDSYKKSSATKCEGPKYRKKNEEVMCANFRYRNKKRSVKTEKISNLKPGTDYIFDIYVSKRRLSLPYDSVRVRTKEKC